MLARKRRKLFIRDSFGGVWFIIRKYTDFKALFQVLFTYTLPAHYCQNQVRFFSARGRAHWHPITINKQSHCLTWWFHLCEKGVSCLLLSHKSETPIRYLLLYIPFLCYCWHASLISLVVQLRPLLLWNQCSKINFAGFLKALTYINCGFNIFNVTLLSARRFSNWWFKLFFKNIYKQYCSVLTVVSISIWIWRMLLVPRMISHLRKKRI